MPIFSWKNGARRSLKPSNYRSCSLSLHFISVSVYLQIFFLRAKKKKELFHPTDAVDFKWTVCTILFIRFMLIADQQNRTNEQKHLICAICILINTKCFCILFLRLWISWFANNSKKISIYFIKCNYVINLNPIQYFCVLRPFDWIWYSFFDHNKWICFEVNQMQFWKR